MPLCLAQPIPLLTITHLHLVTYSLRHSPPLPAAKIGANSFSHGAATPDVTSGCVTSVADEPNGYVMRRCPAQCQAVGGGEKRRHRLGSRR